MAEGCFGRRDFIAAMSAAAFACPSNGQDDSSIQGNGQDARFTQGATVHPSNRLTGFVAPRLEKIRVGVIGVGGRGSAAALRLATIPGVEVTALCDLDAAKVAKSAAAFAKRGFAAPQSFTGPDGYRRLCDAGLCDVVHVNTDWASHAQIALAAMRRGLHAMVEVPGVRTIDEAWEVVETAEKNRVHCMMLANCCYDEDAMAMVNAARRGALGRLMHGEGEYLHETRCQRYGQGFLDRERLFSSLAALVNHTGASYPVHALGPVAMAMDVNRGDRLDYLVSAGSAPFAWHEYAVKKLGADAPAAKIAFEANDFNTTVITTAKGRTILLRQCNTCPTPYTRGNRLYGFNGTIETRPLRIAIEKRFDAGAGAWRGAAETAAFREEFGSREWKDLRAAALKDGGHGGQDYIMDWRWAHCLRSGLPLDTSVYDFASWSAVFEASERSVRNRSRPCDIPDFTRGAWRGRGDLV